MFLPIRFAGKEFTMTERSSIRVLVVDDEPSIRKSLVAFLDDNDFDVSSAESAEYADMKKFVRENPQLGPQGTASLGGTTTTTANSPAARNFRTQPLWGVRLRGRF